MGTLALPCFNVDDLISICIWAFDGICAWMIVGGLPTGNKPLHAGFHLMKMELRIHKSRRFFDWEAHASMAIHRWLGVMPSG